MHQRPAATEYWPYLYAFAMLAKNRERLGRACPVVGCHGHDLTVWRYGGSRQMTSALGAGIATMRLNTNLRWGVFGWTSALVIKMARKPRATTQASGGWLAADRSMLGNGFQACTAWVMT
ncbi:MAG: hypothetical protein ACJA0V_000831 [Planctomycetota bacterium]|jgi:hypothetical protein